MSSGHKPFNIEQLAVDNQLVAIAIEGDATVASIGSDYIRVHSVEGSESVSQPFQLSVEIRADDTEESGLRLDSSYIGYWVKIRAAMPEGNTFSCLLYTSPSPRDRG